MPRRKQTRSDARELHRRRRWIGLVVLLCACAKSAPDIADDAAPRSEAPLDASSDDVPAGESGRGQPTTPEGGLLVDAGATIGRDAVDICGTRVELREYTGSGRELVFDVATHSFATPQNPTSIDLFGFLGAPRLDWIERPADCSGYDCFTREVYETALFGAADTAFTLLTGIPYALGQDGTGTLGVSVANTEYLIETRDWLNQRLGAARVLLAPAVMPNDRIELQLAAMQRLAGHAVAWHAHTGWSPSGGGFWLDDEAGRRMIEQGLALDRGIFMVDKGVPRESYSAVHTSPRDVGTVAAAYPSARFVVLQSAFEHGLRNGETSRPDLADPTRDLGWGPGVGSWPEGPYDELDPAIQAQYPLDRGVNSLVTALREHGIGPNQNVYAALDAVWAELMNRPVEAAHVIGKLLRYVGEDNLLWGTQSLWYGGPRPQIEAFHAFQIPAELQRQYGYAELTDVRKAKILGLNAARLFCVVP